MSSNWRRFEVLLPLQFNDGRDVPPEWLAEAVLEVVDHFGAASYETQKLGGPLAPRRCDLPRQSGAAGGGRARYVAKPRMDEGFQGPLENPPRTA